MFTKGHKITRRGIKNDPRTASLKQLLEDAFIRNQSVALAKIDKMFQGEDMNDFKFMLTLKASIEPKQHHLSGNITFTSKNLLETVQDAEFRANSRALTSAN